MSGSSFGQFLYFPPPAPHHRERGEGSLSKQGYKGDFSVLCPIKLLRDIFTHYQNAFICCTRASSVRLVCCGKYCSRFFTRDVYNKGEHIFHLLLRLSQRVEG